MNSNKVFKRGVSVALALATSLSLSAGTLVMPLAASADATSDLIASLQAQIAALSAQLSALSGGSSSVPSAAGKCSFTRALTVGSRGDDVKCLQTSLNVSPTSGYFGPLTKAAVAKWQAANGVSPAVGYFGALSQAKYNSMMASVPTTPVTPTPGVPAVVGKGLTVSAGVQPAEQLAPNSAARVPFTKVNFTASADGDVTVNSVTAERQGAGTDAALSEVVLLDEDGVQIGIGKTLNSNHQVILNEPFTVKAGQTRTMTIGGSRPATDTTSVAGQIIRLAVVAVNAGSTTVNGSLPIVGNGMTMNASLTIGSVTNQTGTRKAVASTTEAIGTKDFTFTAVRVTAGATEKVKLHSITWNQVGSIGAGDLANVRTFVETTDIKSYDTTVSADGKYYTAKFSPAVLLDKGSNAEIYIKGDVVGGANRTVKFDLYRTTDLNVSGETFGYGITPPTSGTGFTSTNPWYFGSQVTVGKGTLNVENSTAVAAQNVAINLSNQPLGAYSVEVKGEAISVASTVFRVSVGSSAATQLTAVSIVDENGKVVAGPVDPASDYTVTFTDTITYPIGKKVYSLKGKLGTSVPNNASIQASTTPGTNWTTVKGISTNETISPTPSSAVSLNTMTAKTAALTISVSSSPVAQTVVAGANAFVFANYQLDASGSGEDLRMTSVPLEFNAASGATNLTSCQLYDGATSLTTGSNVVNPSAQASSTVFTFDGSGLTIPKGAVKNLALKCNVASGATGGYSWGYDSGSSPSATGLTSGQSATITENDSAGQQMTMTSTGSLAVALDSSSPSYALAAAGTTDNTVSVLRFTSTNEAIDLEKVALTLTNTASNSPSDLVRVTLWDGATMVGTALFTGNSDVATSTLSTVVRIPKDDSKILTVKADLSAQGVSQVGTPGTLMSVDWLNADSTGTQGTGVSSSTKINRTSSANTASNGVRIVKSYPTFAVIPFSSSDAKLVAGRRDLMKFSVTAKNTGEIGIYKFTVRVATTSATALVDMIDGINVYAYTDSSYATPVSGVQSDGGLMPSNIDLSVGTALYQKIWVSASTDIDVWAMTSASASTTVVVPAGQTRYFVVRGDVLTAGATYNASIQIQGDANFVSNAVSGPLASSYLATSTYVEASADNDFIWRPFSTTTTQSLTANDYLNGFGIPGLPTTNSASQSLTQ